jgi:hypothetical protein
MAEAAQPARTLTEEDYFRMARAPIRSRQVGMTAGFRLLFNAGRAFQRQQDAAICDRLGADEAAQAIRGET